MLYGCIKFSRSKTGSYHPSLPPVPSTPTGSGMITPIGHMPPLQLLSPTVNNNNNNQIGFYFDKSNQQQQTVTSPNGQQQQQQQQQQQLNFKYYHGQHY
ncbi:hypothetical protein BLA29_012723 [Euroglyphus maynei]|uniref:Uncharacterized protein n=1 Tax=Euroglyphus maynei TaxID=6958 RepID=A0A1Y3ANH3_EURMA|nr:hypothetical protein BLA29_012723 [Euroglyphus maynei]